MVFVAPEERAVRTEFHAVVDAYDFQIFLMFLAKVSLSLAHIGTGNCIPRRLFERRRQLGAFSKLFTEGNILGEILKVGFRHTFLVAAMLAHDRQFLPPEELTQARRARTVLAVGHHSRLTLLLEGRPTEAAADFLLSRLLTHLIYKSSFRNATLSHAEASKPPFSRSFTLEYGRCPPHTAKPFASNIYNVSIWRTFI